MNASPWLLLPVAAVILLVAVLGIRGWVRGRPSGGVLASRTAAPAPPVTVVLPEESSREEQRKGRRTGETQELPRRIVHGPYRPIGDRGAASDVRIEKVP